MRRKKRQQCFASGGVLHRGDGGTALRSMLCARSSSRNSRLIPLRGRCQEKNEEEGQVKGLKELLVKKKKKRETTRVRTQGLF